jgi:hypothetical protein
MSGIPGVRPREETEGKDPDSRTSGGKSGPIRFNQRCGRLLARPSHGNFLSSCPPIIMKPK